jgi:hypothetical protein
LLPTAIFEDVILVELLRIITAKRLTDLFCWKNKNQPFVLSVTKLRNQTKPNAQRLKPIQNQFRRHFTTNFILK